MYREILEVVLKYVNTNYFRVVGFGVFFFSVFNVFFSFVRKWGGRGGFPLNLKGENQFNEGIKDFL